MREFSKFFRIYCHENHKKWAELLPSIEDWLNKTVASSTGFSPLELMFGYPKPSLFEKLLPKRELGVVDDNKLDEKLRQALVKMKKKIEEREREEENEETQSGIQSGEIEC
jgi:hypothetical protein